MLHLREAGIAYTASMDQALTPAAASSRFQLLVQQLRNPALYPHPVDQVQVLETHISCVLLAGDFAYKLKKPYNLGFLDFTTLAARKHFCEEELRLNRRLAPDLYLAVLPIFGPETAPRLAGSGQILEYALKMRRFPQENLLLHVLQQGKLRGEQLEALAQRIAAFHLGLPGAGAAQDHGEPETLRATMHQNFEQIEPLVESATDRAELLQLQRTQERLFHGTLPYFVARKQAGFVREGHGDLHLGNLVLLHDEIVPFDCIEFNDSFRWNDVMSEIAFMVMDLASRGRRDLGFRFLNAYLEQTGDFDGLQVLRYYLVFRAMVRAKIAAFRASEMETPETERAQDWAEFRHYLNLALHFSKRPERLQVVMHGVSGSGKSRLARDLAAQLPGIHVRSDVERKRLFGLAPLARTQAQPGDGIYTPQASQRTYARMLEIAHATLNAGFTPVVDATFLRVAHRLPFLLLESNTRLVACDAPVAVLRARVQARYAAGNDAAEADVAVLEQQLQEREALTPQEAEQTLRVDTDQALDVTALVKKLKESIGNSVGTAG